MAIAGAIAFVALMLFAIFFHEFGHFITARWAGIKVTRFFVGFGPTLWSFRRGRTEVIDGPDGMPVERPETEYGIKLLPLGGFVKVLGMSAFEDVEEHDLPRSFGSAPAWKRAVVLTAGSVTHFVTAVVVLLFMFTVIGLPDPDRPTLRIEAVAETLVTGPASSSQGGNAAPSPAALAGLRAGDEIVTVDGRRPTGDDTLRTIFRDHPGEDIALTVRGADGTTRSTTITPMTEVRDGERVGIVGVFPALETTRVGPLRGVVSTGRAMGDLMTGFVQAAPRAFSPDALGLTGDGPTEERPFSIIGAGRIAADLADQGQFAMFLFLFVQINIFVAVFNMLPLPPLDGGHLLVVAIEKIRGKAVSPQALLPVMAVVFSVLIVFAAWLFFHDITQPIDIAR